MNANKIFLFTLVFLCFCFPSYAKAENRCHGVSDQEKLALSLGGGNRFSHCKKGDIISAYTASLIRVSMPEASPEGLYHQVNDFSLRYDEVAQVCSLDYPVIEAGETIIDRTAFREEMAIKWFHCVYIGKERDSTFDIKLDAE